MKFYIRAWVHVCGLVLIALLLTGCPPSEEKIKQEVKHQIEQQRVEKLSQLRDRISSSFLLGAIIYVCITLVGPSVAEGVRGSVAKQLNWSKSGQVYFAKFAYWATIVIVGIVSLFNQHLSSMKPAVWLLLGASAYPFFVHVIPSIEAEDKARRKSAMGQVKSLLMLIFIFYVVLRFLSPEGFGEIKLQ
jgi:hypothetical protein